MTDRDAFLRAIAETPDDDAPRLVFADWLDEHGDPARAEFIRLQVGREGREPASPRETELLRTHGSRWLAEVARPGVKPSEFERGLVTCMMFDHLKAFQRHADALLHAPSATVHFRRLIGRTARRLAADSRLASVGGIALSHCGAEPDALADLFASPHLARLRSVEMRAARLTPALAEALASLPALRWLQLSGCHVDSGAAAALASRSSPLVSLALDRMHFGPADMTALAAGDWPNLVGLSLRETGAGEGVAALAGSPRLPRFASLQVEGSGVGDIGAVALADSPHLPALTELYLRDNNIGPVGLAALLARPGLATLDLTRNGIGPRSRWEVPPRVVLAGPPLDLNLDANGITDARLSVIARWPSLGRVRCLSLLASPGLTADGLRALAGSRHVRSLEELRAGSFADGEIHPHGVEALLASPHAVRLAAMDVSRLALVGPPRRPTADTPAGPRSVDVTLAGRDTPDPELAAWLAASATLQRVRRLTVRMPSPADVFVLANSPHLAGVETLVVPGRLIGDLTVYAELRARFGDRLSLGASDA